jgi:acetyl esterase/lipase
MIITPLRSLVFAFLSALSLGALRAADNPVIPLWPEGVPGLKADATPEKVDATHASNVHHPSLTVFRAPADKANGTGVIICPGGSYTSLSIANEGSLIAERLNAIGVTAFVLRYRLKEYGHPAPLQDVLRAVRLIRSQAADFGLKPDRIGVLGASAGGHLAASAGTLFDAPEGRTGAELDKVSGRPDFLVLLYPVITMQDPYAHAGSRKNLIGATPALELATHLSLELQVTKDTPPTFIVQAEDDRTVPVENSLMFYQALHKAGVPAELHLFPKGGHGFGMKKEIGEAATWPDRCEEWLRANGWLTVAP